jgi:uridine monophosphate synthetase
VVNLLLSKLEGIKFDLVCGVPYTALPFATLVSSKIRVPMVMRRKEIKEYGTKKIIEGVYHEGQICVVIEDLVTSGLSVFETTTPLHKEGLVVHDVVVLLDREQGGRRNIESRGIKLHSVLTITQMLNSLEKSGRISPEVVQRTFEFIAANQVTADASGSVTPSKPVSTKARASLLYMPSF